MPKLRFDRKCWSASRAKPCTGIVRRDASMLRASIDRFLETYKTPADQDVAFERVYRRLYQVRYPWRGPTASSWRNCARSCRNMHSNKAWTG
jgi:membrane-bound lytic murein transglycosylase MltF